MMKKGFTILELLVASLLLGMLVTILTTIFNQSSVAWRTGVAGVADIDVARQNIAEIREEADNIYIWKDEAHRVLGLWDDTNQNQLRTRAWDVDAEQNNATAAPLIPARLDAVCRDDSQLDQFRTISVGSIKARDDSIKTYSVNVKSAGPDRQFDTYDDIWSFPDEIN